MSSSRIGRRRNGIVLMYHRVASLDVDPWGLAVSPERFAQQLQHLRRRCQPTTIHGVLHRRLAIGRMPVALTFDDGYLDNLEQALPLLERYEVPVTVFITTGAIGSDEEFWWDRIEQIFLTTVDLPAELPADIVAATEATAVVPAVDPSMDEQSRASRHELFLQVWRGLYQRPPDERTELVGLLTGWAGLADAARPSHRTMSESQLQEFAAHPLVDCQAHSISHPPLPDLDPDRRAEELRGSKTALEEILGQPVVGFAYPHGAESFETRLQAADAGYHYACTTTAGPVRHDADRLAVPRCGVGDWDAEEFDTRLRSWWADR